MQLHFKEFGHGEPLIVLHGLLGSSDNFLGVTKTLAEKFRLFLLDLRNHGNSPHSEEMNYPVMADDVAEFLDSQKLRSANVLGHSMGGKVAIQFAFRHPAKIRKLVVVDVAPRVYEPAHAEIFSALLALDLKSFATRQEIEDALASQIPNLVVRRFLLKNLGRNAAGEFFWKINLRGIFENYSRLRDTIAATEPFTKPVLFIRGGKSKFIRESDLPLIRNLFPRSEVRTIADANHWVHADAPEEFTRQVVEFLAADDAD